jgi:hypothetical protein
MFEKWHHWRSLKTERIGMQFNRWAQYFKFNGFLCEQPKCDNQGNWCLVVINKFVSLSVTNKKWWWGCWHLIAKKFHEQIKWIWDYAHERIQYMLLPVLREDSICNAPSILSLLSDAIDFKWQLDGNILIHSMKTRHLQWQILYRVQDWMPAPDKKYMVHLVHNYVSIYVSVLEPKQGSSPNTLKITRSICKPFDKLWRGK